MFESWISDLLANSLGQFIDVKTDQLKISLWEGVTIENARIRNDAFDHLQLPFQLKHGCVGKLHIQVPWRALYLSPIVVHVSDVCITVAPYDVWEGEDVLRRRRRAKQAEIVAAEFGRVTNKVSSTQPHLFRRITAQIWNFLLKRFRLRVEGVRVTFEGRRASHLAPYAFGLSVEEICTIEGIEIAERQPRNPLTEGEILKAISVRNLSVFWIADAEASGEEESFVLAPTSLQVYVYLQSKSTASTQSRFEAHVELESLNWIVSPQQIVSVASFLDDLSLWRKRAKYVLYRPSDWESRCEMKTQGKTERRPIDYAAVWRYAIQSVLQDLSKVASASFSVACVKRYGDWRRQYLPLYVQKLKEEALGHVISSALRLELEEIEDSIPVHVVMLLRSIAEDCCLYGEDTRNKERLSYSWMRSSLSNALSLFRSPEIVPLLKEAPNERQIEGMYAELETKNNESQPEAFSLCVELKIDHAEFHLMDSEARLATLSCENGWLDVSVSQGEVNCRGNVANVTGVESNNGHDAGFLEFDPRLTEPVIRLRYVSSDPVVRVKVSGMRLCHRPALYAKLRAIHKQLPQITFSKWSQYSAYSMETKKSRILMQLHQPSSLPVLLLRFSSPRIVFESADHLRCLVIGARTLEAEWKKDGAETGAAFNSLFAMDDDAFVSETIEPFVYSKWVTSAVGASVTLDTCDASSSICLVEPFSATGNLYFNLAVVEASLPALITDWRLTPLVLNGTTDTLHLLKELIAYHQKEHSTEALLSEKCDRVSSDGADVVQVHLAVSTEGVSLELQDVFVDSAREISFEKKLEISFSYQRIKVLFDETFVSEDAPLSSFNFLSQTGAVHVVLIGECFKADCTMQSLNLQDVTDYKQQRPQLTHGIPRLGRNLSAKEFTSSLRKDREGTRVSGALTNVEGNGYINEAGGHIQSNRSSNAVTLRTAASEGRTSFELDLDHMVLGSTFLLRLYGFLVSPSSRPEPSVCVPDCQEIRVVKKSHVRIQISNSCFGFPMDIHSVGPNPAGNAVAVLLCSPEFLLSTTTAHFGYGCDSPLFSATDVNAFSLREGSIMTNVHWNDVNSFVPTLSISEAILVTNCKPSLADVHPNGVSTSREVRYDLRLDKVYGRISTIGLEQLLTSMTSFRSLVATTFPLPSRPKVAPEHSRQAMDERIESELSIAEVSVVLADADVMDPTPFRLKASQINGSHQYHNTTQEAALSWQELNIVFLRQFPEMELYLMKADGLHVKRSDRRGDLEESESSHCPKAESLDEEDGGSVSSSTSWQTAGSQVSTARRTSSSLQATTDFESVEETKPFLSTELDNELSPFLETISNSPAPSEEEEELLTGQSNDRDAELDLMLFEFKHPEGQKTVWKSTVDKTTVTFPSLKTKINVTHLADFVRKLESLIEKRELLGSGTEAEKSVHWDWKPFRAKTEGCVVIFSEVPLQSKHSLELEPPSLQTSVCFASIKSEITASTSSFTISSILLESSWIKCSDPTVLQHMVLRELGSLFSLKDATVHIKWPNLETPSGIHNAYEVDAEVREVELDISLQKTQPLTSLIEHLTVLKPLEPSMSGPFQQGGTPRSSSTLARYCTIARRQHLKASFLCGALVVSVVDDVKAVAFPLLRGTCMDTVFEAESLSGSEVVVWDVRFKPEAEMYNRQALGWECVLQQSPWIASGKWVLTGSAEAEMSHFVTFSSFDLSSETPIELNITSGMIRTAFHVYHSAEDLFSVAAMSNEIPSVSFWIRNLTGSDVECTMFDSIPADPFLLVKSDTCQSVHVNHCDRHQTLSQPGRVLRLDSYDDFEEYEENMREALTLEDVRLSFRLRDQLLPCGPLSPITAGDSSFSVQSDSALVPMNRDVTDPIDRLFNRSIPKKTALQCRVHVRPEGAMEVELHSNVRLTNETAYRIEVGCWTGEEISPQITSVEPKESYWVPVMTVAHGRFAVRPRPRSSERFPLRCAWSQSLILEQIPKVSSFVKLRCDPVSGGLRPVWLHVEIRRGSLDGVMTVSVHAPVIVHNYLPSPLDVAISCDEGKTTALKGRVDRQCSMQGHTINGKDITTLRLVPARYRATDISPQSLDVPSAGIGMFRESVEDVIGEDIDIKIGSGLVPVSVRHRVEGCSGRHVFEVCCPFWIYNCTDNRFAVRQTQQRAQEENVLDEEDVVPDRWVLPLAEKVPGGSRMAHSSASASGLGLQTLLEKGQPERFRFHSGAQKLSNERGKQGTGSGSRDPSMEIGGSSHRGPLRLQFRTSGSQAAPGMTLWSESVSIDAAGAAAVVRCVHPIHATSTFPAFPNAAYFLAVTCLPIPRCGEAAALHVMPRYILNNSTSFHLQYRQQGIRIERELPVDNTQSIHWPDVSKPLLLSVRIQEAGWMWSGGLVVDAPGDTMVKLRHRVREETMLVQMDVSLHSNGVLLATLMHQSEGFAPYRLDNFTSEKIHVRQYMSGSQEDVLRPYSSMPYAWDEPAGQHKVVMEGAARKLIGVFKLDSVGDETRVMLVPEPSDVYSNRVRHLKITIQAEGPTRVLSILDEAVHPHVAMPSRVAPPGNPCKSRFIHVGGREGLEIVVRFPSVGLSLVSEEREIVYFHVRNPSAGVILDDARISVRCSLEQFQLDNCLRKVKYPVLAHGPITHEAWTGMMDALLSRKALELTASVWRQRPGGVLCMEKLLIDLAPFALNMEETTVRQLLCFFNSLKPREDGNEDAVDALLNHDRTPVTLIPRLKIYIEELSISPCRVTFSFSPGVSRSVDANASFLQTVVSLVNFEDVQVHLGALKLRHPLLSVPAMMALLGRHYTTSLLQEIYKIVGSADILGDPVHLVQRLGLGVWLLFANPTYALVKSRALEPVRLLAGCASGVSSLISNVVFGFTNAAAKMSMASRNSLVLFFQLEEHLSSSKNSSDLLRIVLEGSADVMKFAAQGLDTSGLVGFCNGLLTGLAKLVVRPVALILKMVSDVMDGISTSLSEGRTKIRLYRVPRFVSHSRALSSYDFLTSTGAEILKDVRDGAFRNERLYGCFASSDEDGYLLVTRRFLLSARWKVPTGPSSPSLVAVIPLEDVECVRRGGTSVTVFGFAPLSCWKSQMVLTKSGTSPFFTETLHCADLATSCRLSVTLQIACDTVPRRTLRLGHGFRITHL